MMNGKTLRVSPGALCVLTCGLVYMSTLSAHGTSEPAEPGPISGEAYVPISQGTRKIALGEVTIRMLIDESNSGREDIEIGELILPAGSPDSVPHAHGSLEIFYVVEGILGHEVNGKPYKLHPGDVGYLKPGDQVVHRALSDVPVKAVVIWVPGGEADALVEHAGFVDIPLE